MSQPEQLPRRLIRGLMFEADGSVSIDFMDPPKDAKANGVMFNHSIYVPAESDYIDTVDRLRELTMQLVGEVLADAPDMEAIDAREGGFDEDETSPYDNPGERDLSRA
jgi:hypothetical protein